MPPETLYKYRCWSEECHRRLLTNNEIFFSSPKHFNDPFDSTIPVRYDKLTKNELRAVISRWLIREEPNLKKHHKKLGKKINSKMKELTDPNISLERMREQREFWNKKVGIFSLAECKDNILMWSHYADCHKGVCVGFDYLKIKKYIKDGCEKWMRYEAIAFPKRCNIDVVISLFKVEYQKEYPVINPAEIRDKNNIFIPITTKSDQWEYEKEYRLILVDRTDCIKILPKNTINEVILGCRMESSHRDEIKRVLKKKNENIELYEAKMKEESFGLDFERVDY